MPANGLFTQRPHGMLARLPYLDLLLGATAETPLQRLGCPFLVLHLLDVFEVVHVLGFLSPLVQIIPRAFP